MPLETGRIKLVEAPEIGMCEMCGAGPMPGRMAYVSFDANAQDVPAGMIETVDHQPGQVGYRVRDPYGHGTTTLTVRLPQICCDCIKQAAELVGFGDTGPLATENEKLREENDNLRERLEASEHQRDQAEAAYRELAVRERILAAGRDAKPTAKRPARKG